ncbi:hypothetical protein L6164_031825 [Bauhinia variegata]|uniref:Uncharacterized protein n=1 Tax=Bauhinia variegata TaxID=167791 RepID=A0ACB9KLU5_BAUVA|nr:hypothetical protein L6164_031825 [Bauhinia variegata]
MHSSICMPLSSSSHNPLLGDYCVSLSLRPSRTFRIRRRPTKALLSSTKQTVFKDFQELRALKIFSGLQNFNKDHVASVMTAADKLVKLAIGLTSCLVCVSSVDPVTFPAAVEAGALMVEIGNYDSFCEKGIVFTPEQILGLAKETRRILPSVALSVTVPHTLSLPDQVKLAEALEQEGVDIIQTEGGKCSNPTKSGVLVLIEKQHQL